MSCKENYFTLGTQPAHLRGGKIWLLLIWAFIMKLLERWIQFQLVNNWMTIKTIMVISAFILIIDVTQWFFNCSLKPMGVSQWLKLMSEFLLEKRRSLINNKYLCILFIYYSVHVDVLAKWRKYNIICVQQIRLYYPVNVFVYWSLPF